jgi:hypothetical protein
MPIPTEAQQRIAAVAQELERTRRLRRENAPPSAGEWSEDGRRKYEGYCAREDAALELWITVRKAASIFWGQEGHDVAAEIRRLYGV